MTSVAAVLLLIAGGATWLYVQFDRAFRPNPPYAALPALVRNLPGPLVTDVQKAFHARVRDRFPNGIGADALATELRHEGFTLGSRQQELGGVPLSPRLYFAFVEQHGGVCLQDWSIQWHRDALGRAQDIDGRYRYDCP